MSGMGKGMIASILIDRGGEMTVCPCGSEKTYTKCCGPLIKGTEKASTPEQLMRSRYTAFTQADVDYIAHTMKGRARRDFDAKDSKQWAEAVKWVKLDVIKSSMEGDKGSVEFIAHFIENGEPSAIHECSEFIKEDEEWFYIDGAAPPVQTMPKKEAGRNDPCPCNSGKKYKKCCLK